MPAIIQQILSGNFSAPLTLIFILFTLLAFYFLFRLGWLFFVRGDEFADSAQGKRETRNLLRLLIICVFISLFTGFVFQFVSTGREVAQQNAPGAARSFFDWLLGK
jgi:formate hydrogenlyase subunit 3/multisubunit Na+/H+ antiporter MnhD subunit